MDICEEYLPQSVLRPFVECVWYTKPATSAVFDIIPDGCVDACFILSESAPRTVLFGTTTRTSAYQMEIGAPYFGVRFRPGKASPFIHLKISELTDAQLEVSDFLGLTSEQILGSKNLIETRRQLESVLLKALSNNAQEHCSAVNYAISLVDSRHGDVRVRDVAHACNLSERQLERLFIERVGITPKLYARIRRFRSVLNLFDDPVSLEKPSLAGVAAEYGYTDQSHLMRDFNGFAHPLPTSM